MSSTLTSVDQGPVRMEVCSCVGALVFLVPLNSACVASAVDVGDVAFPGISSPF